MRPHLKSVFEWDIEYIKNLPFSSEPDYLDYKSGRILGKDTIDLVLANSKKMSSKLVLKYSNDEQKDPVELDLEELEKKDIYVIADKLYTIEDGYYRHDSLKTGYLIFSYLMDGDKK